MVLRLCEDINVDGCFCLFSQLSFVMFAGLTRWIRYETVFASLCCGGGLVDMPLGGDDT